MEFPALFSREANHRFKQSKMNTVGAFLTPEAERFAMLCDCFNTKFNLHSVGIADINKKPDRWDF